MLKFCKLKIITLRCVHSVGLISNNCITMYRVKKKRKRKKCVNTLNMQLQFSLCKTLATYTAELLVIMDLLQNSGQ